MKHLKFWSRTVFVNNNQVEEACRVLNRILGKEEIFDQYRRTRYYEKPYQVDFCYLIYILEDLQMR
jgi:small subunit ribosomal protein S21